MLTSISPVGERGRAQRFGITATAYVLGSVAGGAAVGTLGALLVAVVAGPPTPAVAAALLTLGAVVGLVLERAGRLPTLHRQVDERWLGRYRGWVYGAGFGVQLGAGVVTIVPRSATYLVVASAALTGTPAAGAAVGALFGAARAAPLLATARLRDPAALRAWHRGVVAAGPGVDRLVTATQAACALALLAAAVLR